MLLPLRVPKQSSHLALSLALGMLVGCGPTPGSATDGDPASTGPAATASTGPSTPTGTAPSITTGADPSTTSPGTTGSTDPVLTSTGMTSTTSSDSSSGPDSSTGGDTGTGCVVLMQGNTNPPVPSGWEKCGDKLPHRVSAEVCLVPAAPADCPFPFESCKDNVDCQGVPFGSCQEDGDQLGCGCVPGCETDADCEPGHVCRCAGDVLGRTSTCVPSNCETDADCGNQRCQFAQSEGEGCGAQVIHGSCSTPKDKCDSDLPCDGMPCVPFAENNQWACAIAWCN